MTIIPTLAFWLGAFTGFTGLNCLIFITTILIFTINITQKISQLATLHTINYKKLSPTEIENKKMKSLSLKRQHILKTIKIGKDEIQINMQTFIPQTINKKKKNAILIHGFASTSFLAFGNTLPLITKYFNVYLLDLPGFGRSYASSKIHKKKNHEIISFYVECINQLRLHNNINTAIYIAHSYGGFLTTHYAHKYGKYISHLYLLDSTGFLPILGTYGAFWGFIFKLFIPNLLISLTQVARIIKINSFQFNTELQYILDILSSHETWGNNTLANFITITFKTCHWNTPALLELAKLNCPVCLIYGSNDTIMPPLQGKVLSKILNIQFHQVANCFHSPLSEGDVPALLKFIHSNKIKTIPSTPELTHSTIKQLRDFMNITTSYFHIKKTQKCLDDFYNNLPKFFSQFSSPSSRK